MQVLSHSREGLNDVLLGKCRKRKAELSQVSTQTLLG